MASVDCYTRFGVATSASPVAWAGGGSRRNFVDWLPKMSEPFGIVRDGKVYFTQQAWNFLRELSERVGGVNGPSIPQVVATQTAVQSQVAETLNYAVQGVDYATQVAATASATAEVAASNGLSGAGSIPETGDPPPRPGTHVR